MHDIVRELDAEIERVRGTVQQRLSSSPASRAQREKIVEDVLLATEWAIRLQLVRQGDDVSYQQFRMLLETYLRKLTELK